MADDKANPASRRGVFKAGVAILAAGAAGAAFAKAQAAPAVKLAQSTKIAKAQLMYQDHPNPDGQHCAICAQFEAPDQCKIVEGPISPNGWCAAFAPKAS
jgi:hypothetical protein